MTKDKKNIMLRAVVSGFIIAERPFTSTDVANHMKRLGVWIRNKNVASFLRENVLNMSDEYGIDYTVSIISVDIGKMIVRANCYHITSFNSDDYLSRDTKAITPDAFESMHGIPAFEVEEPDPAKPVPVVVDGGIKFNFPGSK